MAGVQYNATWSHGPVSGPINGFLGAVFFTLLGKVWNKLDAAWPAWHNKLGAFPVWLPLVVAVLGVAAAVIVGRERSTAGKNIFFRSVCWAGAGLWSTLTIMWGWSLLGIVILIAGAVFAGLLSPVFASYVEAPEPDPIADIDRGMAGQLRVLIPRYLNMKQHEAPIIEKITDWRPADAGSTWVVTGQPGSRFSWRHLREIQTDLASGLGLPDGCPVQSEPAGTTQNQALLKVSTKNYMKDPIDYPRDYSELSVTQEFSVGRFLDATPTLIELYQAAGLAAGQRGGGKTVLLQNITASLARCRDVVVWHVDLNGGGMSAPWTTPFAEEAVKYPAVDWVATTPREALLMAKTALRIAKDRKAKYQRLLIKEGTDVLPVRSDLPLIMIIVDEAAEVTGETAVKEAQEVSKALQEVQRIGRAMCINVFFSTLRATGDYLPAGLKKGASVAFCTRVKDESELAYVFDWHKGINVEDLTEPGQMFMQRGTGPVKMFKSFRLLPPQIIEITHAVQPIRACVGLDKRALQVAGDIYRDRWLREDTAKYLASLRGEDDDDLDFDSDDDAGQQDVLDDIGESDSALAEFEKRMKAIREGRAAQATAQPAAQATAEPAEPPSIPVEEQQRLLAQLDQLPVFDPRAARPVAGNAPAPSAGTQPAQEKGPQARRAFILQIVEDSGEAGMKTEDVIAQTIAAGFTTRRQTVNEDLAKLRSDGELTQRKAGAEVNAMWWVPRYAA